MLLLSEATLSQVQQQLVLATHQMTSVDGRRVTLGTIDGERLRAAALAALAVIAGSPVDTLPPSAIPPTAHLQR